MSDVHRLCLIPQRIAISCKIEPAVGRAGELPARVDPPDVPAGSFMGMSIRVGSCKETAVIITASATSMAAMGLAICHTGLLRPAANLRGMCSVMYNGHLSQLTCSQSHAG